MLITKQSPVCQVVGKLLPREHAEKLFSERVKVWNSLPPSIVSFCLLATFRNSVNKIRYT